MNYLLDANVFMAANNPRKVNIPNVCVGLGIKVMTPFEMLRHERARFILGTGA